MHGMLLTETWVKEVNPALLRGSTESVFLKLPAYKQNKIYFSEGVPGPSDDIPFQIKKRKWWHIVVGHIDFEFLTDIFQRKIF